MKWWRTKTKNDQLMDQLIDDQTSENDNGRTMIERAQWQRSEPDGPGQTLLMTEWRTQAQWPSPGQPRRTVSPIGGQKSWWPNEEGPVLLIPIIGWPNDRPVDNQYWARRTQWQWPSWWHWRPYWPSIDSDPDPVDPIVTRQTMTEGSWPRQAWRRCDIDIEWPIIIGQLWWPSQASYYYWTQTQWRPVLDPNGPNGPNGGQWRMTQTRRTSQPDRPNWNCGRRQASCGRTVEGPRPNWPDRWLKLMTDPVAQWPMTNWPRQWKRRQTQLLKGKMTQTDPESPDQPRQLWTDRPVSPTQTDEEAIDEWRTMTDGLLMVTDNDIDNDETQWQTKPKRTDEPDNPVSGDNDNDEGPRPVDGDGQTVKEWLVNWMTNWPDEKRTVNHWRNSQWPMWNEGRKNE